RGPVRGGFANPCSAVSVLTRNRTRRSVMAEAPQRVSVVVDGHTLSISNIDKVLYPNHGFTKGEVIDYYSRIAPVLLPHLVDRPLTVKRYPNGVNAPFFFEKNAPRGAPSWVRTVRLPVPGSTMN